MPKVNPFHADEPEKPRGHRVHHIYTQCHAARLISRKLPGPMDRLCDFCKDISRNG
jgi:hypothetical protein